MSITTKKRIFSIIILIITLLCVSLVIYSFKYYFPKMQNKKFLQKYGWEILYGGRDGKDFELNSEYLSRELSIMQIDASKKINLDPQKYTGKSIVKYAYTLKQMGINDKLRADVWLYKNKIICAYIYHVENNVNMKYWSLDTPYQTLISELHSLKAK